MYLEFFNLSSHPFRLTPDADFLYLSESHARARACMEQACRQRDALAVITGEVGCGKTILVNRLVSDMPADVAVARLTQTNLDSEEFLQSVLSQYGFQPFKRDRQHLKSLLDNFLFAQNVRERPVVLIIEEAQNLSSAVLEVVRELADLEDETEKFVSIILVGQPMLRERMAGRELKTLASRVSCTAHLEPLTQIETLYFIKHRLKVAGCQNPPFDHATYPEIYGYTGGVPRVIVHLCDAAMTAAFADDSPRVTTEILRCAIEALELKPVADADPDLEPEPEPEPEPAAKPEPGRDDEAASAREPVDKRSVSLSIFQRGKHLRDFAVDDYRVMIGRDSDNDVTIISEYISRHHAQIVIDHEGQYWVKDLNSTNGLFVNGQKSQRCPLHDGDRVALGYHEIVFHDSEAASASTEPEAERSEWRETAVLSGSGSQNSSASTASEPVISTVDNDE